MSIIEDFLLQDISVKYNGKKYYGNNLSISFNDNNISHYEVNELPKELKKILDIEEDDNFIFLKLGSLNFNMTEDIPCFYFEYHKKIGFDKKNLKGIGEKLVKEDMSDDICFFYNNLPSYILSTYLFKISKLNNNIYNFFNKKTSEFDSLSEIGTINILNLFTFNFFELEKLISSNNLGLFLDKFDEEIFEFKESNKLQDVIGLPKFAVNTIKKLNLEYALNNFKELAKTVDGNSLKIFFEFIENYNYILSESYYDEEDIEEFINNCVYLCKKGFKLTDLLKYLIKQCFYSPLNDSSYTFSFPNVHIKLLKDYHYMAEKFGLKVEKYPSLLKKQHDLLANNTEFFYKSNDELEKKFSDATALYKEVEMEIKFKVEEAGVKKEKAYVFITPKKSIDLVQEGNNLHHCVGNYIDQVISQDSRIVFMRDASKPNESLVTIDINKHFKVIEAVGMANMALTKEQEKAVNLWTKKISK